MGLDPRRVVVDLASMRPFTKCPDTSTALTVTVVDIGAPGRNLGWAMDGPVTKDGDDLDACIKAVATGLRYGPVALGFEAPMFVPFRNRAEILTKARQGESGPGLPSRPFSASGGATVLVTALVVVPFVLNSLRRLAPEANATLDWRTPLRAPGDLLLFEAFVTNQRKTADTRHVEDARLAVAAFRDGLRSPGGFVSAVSEPSLFSLLGATLLRTGWTTDLAVLSEPCLVVRA